MIERTHRSHGPRGVQISPRTSKAWLRAVYAATKAAVEAMTGILAKELRGRNITVNAIAPGPTATKLFLDGKPQEVIERLSKLAPLERLGQPQDIADAVAFLAGPDGAWINGQTLRANGGII
jgi:3-oxoacyl-[acyl-carrier protein] reductase